MTVRSDREGGVLRLTIENPPANVLSVALMEQLLTSLEAAGSDGSVRVIVIAAAGKLFSAGHDLKDMTMHRSDPDEGKAYFEQVFTLCSRLMQAIAAHSRPVIAEVDGIATAAGCQLVASCDLAVASDRSRFGVNGIDVGLFCSTPAVALTRTISRKRAMEMLLTGEMIEAQTALEYGLVNRVLPKADLRNAVDQCAAIIASKSTVAVTLGKQSVREQAGLSLADAYERASRVMVENMLEPDAEEGISAFLKKRKPKWQ
jgi:enoyl-CoA hydratase/carnithine racemase